MIKPIQILNDLIESTLHRVTVESITDNLDGTYILSVNNTYYLSLKSKVTIDSVEYKVVDFVLNNSLTLKGAVLPTAEFFDIDSPRFIHGTPKKINGEYTNQNINEYPFIWLLEFLDADYDDTFDGSVKAVLDLNLFFLTHSDFTDWNIDKNYSYAIDPMANEIDFFIRTLKAREDLFGELSSHTVTNHVNFGTYITDKGYDSQIITDQLSGCQLRISLPYVVDVCIGDLPIISKCFPVSIYKDMIFEKFVPSGGRFDYASSSCLDATSIVKNSLGTILYTNIIPSGDTNNQTITDAANTLNAVSIAGVLAQGTKAITLKDDLGATINPTILVNTKTNLDLEIPVGVSGIAYVRDQWTMNEGTSNITGDLKDYINTTDVFTTYTVNGIAPILDPNDLTKLLNINHFGSLDLVTNDKGGTNYTDVGGGLTSDGATAKYAINHFSGKGHYLSHLHSGTENWNDSIVTVKAFTLSAFDGSTYGSTDYGQFTMLTEKDVNDICVGDGLTNIFNGINNWTDNFHWIMFSATSSSIFFWRDNQKISASNRFNGFPPTSVNSGIDLIVLRNHF